MLPKKQQMVMGSQTEAASNRSCTSNQSDPQLCPLKKILRYQMHQKPLPMINGFEPKGLVPIYIQAFLKQLGRLIALENGESNVHSHLIQ